MAVRENLHNFLDMYTKKISGDTYVWVDQLCITQQDIEERNQQVGMMSVVCTNAIQVIA
jgi:hypothetical protein